MDELKAWEDKFNACLGIELNDPQYFQVHHLLVLSHMLQSNRYTDEYLPEALRMLKALLEGSLSIDRKAIQSINTKYSSDRRTKRLVRPAQLRENISWNKTILDIRLDSVHNYQNDVIEWAESILQVLEVELTDEQREMTN